VGAALPASLDDVWADQLTAAEGEAVLALVARATAVDGTAGLNEDAHFALTDDSAAHLLQESDGTLVGYLQWQPDHSTAQLVVDPAHRRQGIGSDLLTRLEERTPPAVWAFGDLPAARAFAVSRGLAPSRVLLKMSATLGEVPAPELPEGLTLRGFTPADAAELLAVNAAAFADHPEQGDLDADGLARRMAEDWFDPEGLILAFDRAGLAGFHWTKAEHGVGEVYVLGVHPRAQGHGYGRLLLQAGLSHLIEAGSPTVNLYVDAADRIAVRMYERAGFAEVHRDVLYTRTQE